MEPDNTPRRGSAAIPPVLQVTDAAWRARQAIQDIPAAMDLPLEFPPAQAPVPADPPPVTALHDDRLWQLARRGQGAVLSLEFELRTRLARQAFRRDFAYVSRQLLGLESSRRVQGLDRAALDDALSDVRRLGDDLQARFARLAGELDTLLVPAGSAALELATPTRLRATVLSPSARRFIELLKAVDEVVCRVEHAWLLGALPPPRRSALVGECRRALAGFKERVRERRHAIGTRVRELGARPPPA